MALGKQAKVLSKAQVEALLGYLTGTRNPHRNRVIVFLSLKAGFRAKEIASLKWEMVTDSSDQVSAWINLVDAASKGASGRVIPINRELRQALVDLRTGIPTSRLSPFVITTERSTGTSAQVVVNLFARWYSALGFSGCSSHSGRRTFVTNAARKISTVGGSLRDIQVLAGHTNLRTTQRYIEADAEAQKRIVDLV